MPIDRLPATFPYIFKAFIEGRRSPERTTWFENLERWSQKAGISPKVNPKTPRKTVKSWILKAGIPGLRFTFAKDTTLSPVLGTTRAYLLQITK